MHSTPILALNDRWRVASDGALQWIIEHRVGPTRWQQQRYHGERDALLCSIRELCGAVDASALTTIGGWPPRHPGRDASPSPSGGSG